MAGYDQKVKSKARYKTETKEFFRFLQAVGRKYPRPVKVNYRYLGRGYFCVIIDGDPGGIDALFQELFLDRGLYYYGCSLRTNKGEVVNNVIAPIFQQLLDERFQNPYSRFLRRHILGKLSQEKFMPGDFKDTFSHEYEILFRKWDRQMVDDWNFIKDVDGLLTQFMLTRMSHVPGARSPVFAKLVEQVQKKGVGMMDEVKDRFNEVHKERTHGLHRLKVNLTKEEISQIAFALYNYFQYFDEFAESQKIKTEILHGKRYRRIKYGDEKWDDPSFIPEEWKEITDLPCHDCAAIRGQYHCEGCDVEVCARCSGQRLGCPCKLQKDFY